MKEILKDDIINLSDKQINDDCEYLSQIKCHTINLNHNNISEIGCKHLNDGCKSLAKLNCYELNLRLNYISKEGYKHLENINCHKLCTQTIKI